MKSVAYKFISQLTSVVNFIKANMKSL